MRKTAALLCALVALPVVGCESDAQLEEVLEDWTGADLDIGKLMALVEALPTHADELVDPACWPTPPADLDAPRNQTERASVATIPL